MNTIWNFKNVNFFHSSLSQSNYLLDSALCKCCVQSRRWWWENTLWISAPECFRDPQVQDYPAQGKSKIQHLDGFFFFFFSWRLRKSSYIFQTKHIRWRFSVIERILRPPGLYLTLLTEVSAKVLIISQPPPPGPHFAFNVESNGVEALNVRAPKTLCLIWIPAFSLHGHVTLGNLQAWYSSLSTSTK